MEPKNQLQDYTRNEFLALVVAICEAEGSDQHQDRLLENFIAVSEHPAGSDLIFYPENPEDSMPERIVEIVEQWRAQNGLSGFKSAE
ncbi:MAG TPA: bacteriocin immunity protein [Marinobacter sp.]|nr:bacteriocin immunity protein [Marinobacter sp.]